MDQRARVDRAIRAAAIVAIGLTLWFSLGPAPSGPGSDRQLHALAYFVDTLALLLAVVWRPGGATRRAGVTVWAVALGMLVLGGLIEMAQGLVGRDAQLSDWLADAAGIAMAVAVFEAVRWGLPSRSPRDLR